MWGIERLAVFGRGMRVVREKDWEEAILRVLCIDCWVVRSGMDVETGVRMRD
jgi:hypothetical protein